VATALGPCPLCGRAMVDGPSVDRHHLVPKSEGGRRTVVMHRICHRKIHSVLEERDLATTYPDPEALRAHPEIARFVRWLARKPPEFYKRTETAKARRR
jgi:hypothetical protein